MRITEEEFKAKMLEKSVTNVNADWQKEVLEASIHGTALPSYPRDAQLKALMQAELVKVSQHGLFAGKSSQKSEPASTLHHHAKPSSTTPKPKA